MFGKNENNNYNPVTAPVPGVDPIRRDEELMEQSLAGDPQSTKTIPKEKIIFKKFGIKIVK